MSALASARAERAPLCDRPAPAGTLDLSLGVFGFARDSRVVSLKVLGVPVACSHDLGASHHDRRHLIDKDFLLSLPDGARLLEAARATKPSPACRAVICLADADVYELGTDFASGARPDAHLATRLRVLDVPLPVTLRVRPGTLAGSPRNDAGDPNASGSQRNSPRASPTRRGGAPARPRARLDARAMEAPPRAPGTTSSRTSCSPCATRGRRGPNPGRSRSDTERDQAGKGMLRSSSLLPAATKTDGGGDEKDDSSRTTRVCCDAHREKPVLTRSTIARRSRVCGLRTTRLVRHTPPLCTPRRTASPPNGLA